MTWRRRFRPAIGPKAQSRGFLALPGAFPYKYKKGKIGHNIYDHHLPELFDQL
jgi:hypothetical protein